MPFPPAIVQRGLIYPLTRRSKGSCPPSRVSSLERVLLFPLQRLYHSLSRLLRAPWQCRRPQGASWKDMSSKRETRQVGTRLEFPSPLPRIGQCNVPGFMDCICVGIICRQDQHIKLICQSLATRMGWSRAVREPAIFARHPQRTGNFASIIS